MRSLPRCSSSANQRICASGVRSSCDTPDTNSVRRRASSCCRRSLNERDGQQARRRCTNSATSIGRRDCGKPPTTSMVANSLFRLTRMMSRPKFGSIGVDAALYVGATQPGRLVHLVPGERRHGDRQNRVDRQAVDERLREAASSRSPCLPRMLGEDRREEWLRIGDVAVELDRQSARACRARRRTRRAAGF